ncbi:LysR substrate-binding domain-containing protein [Burkholderia lata]|uniref:Transcriptional regulator, LysR family n=1 Tax=Burkholderia lata (strain ATCC 17760 / DSM 23089 / LMG 22485 / NCIMB 9086 / R18194 / 383) TaxID=482957 RepID=Q390H5_BURL3|nr:LysR substrate-binding domain-containing protein [Burkholderia lata]ABB13141.1 transcriptional regulator, LysR family [Burkholderia lata]
MNQPSENMNPDLISGRRNAGNFLRLRHLRMLELVADGGSLAAAARTLHLSQPAITKMLQEMEAVFGTMLVTRGARGGRLTADGEAVLQRLRIALAQFDIALAGDGNDDGRPLLRIGMLPVVSVALLPQIMRNLTRDAPAPRLTVMESNVSGLLDALSTGRIDCIISRPDAEALAKLDGLDVTIVPVYEEPLAIACPLAHPFADARRISTEQLQREEWIVPHAGTDTRRAFDALFVDHGLMPPRPLVESMSFHTNLQMADALGALTVAPQSAVLHYARMGVIRRVGGFPVMPVGEIALIHLATMTGLPALQRFRDAVEAAAHTRR